MTEAEEKKLEVAGRREDRKDGEKDMGEDPTETTEGKRRDGQDEEIPAWADALMKRLDAIERRDRKDEDEKRPIEAADRKDRKDEGDHDEDTDREDRARRDAQVLAENRRLAAKIAEMESRLSAVYREPSIEDREALAEARSRADVLYQALENRPASSPIPGESPIAYRKRLVDGLRKYSDRMKDVRVDALTGEAFAVIEDRICTDAEKAIRSDAIIPANTLRPITVNDRGHFRTDYVGDSSVWTEPFSAGAVRRLKFINPKAAH